MKLARKVSKRAQHKKTIEVHISLQNIKDTSPCRTLCLKVSKARELQKNCITQEGLVLVVERWQIWDEQEVAESIAWANYYSGLSNKVMSFLLFLLSFFPLSTDRPLRDPIEFAEKVLPFLTEDVKE